MQNLVDNNNKDRVKSAKDLLTFLLPAFPLPIYLLWATLLFITLPFMPPNASKKRLNKAYLSSIFKKRAKKAADANMEFKIAIKLYILVILF